METNVLRRTFLAGVLAAASPVPTSLPWTTSLPQAATRAATATTSS
ncbi:hypothetical protein [Kitasatospora sp. NPDC056531]